MHIECRQRQRRSHTVKPDTLIRVNEWGAWETCEGTEGLTLKECAFMRRKWEKDDPIDTPWLRIEYRIIGDDGEVKC